MSTDPSRPDTRGLLEWARGEDFDEYFTLAKFERRVALQVRASYVRAKRTPAVLLLEIVEFVLTHVAPIVGLGGIIGQLPFTSDRFISIETGLTIGTISFACTLVGLVIVLARWLRDRLRDVFITLQMAVVGFYSLWALLVLIWLAMTTDADVTVAGALVAAALLSCIALALLFRFSRPVTAADIKVIVGKDLTESERVRIRAEREAALSILQERGLLVDVDRHAVTSAPLQATERDLPR